MNTPMFGAAYYAEYLAHLEDRTNIDLQLMAKAGMNTIRIAESTWSTEEIDDGVFDFSYIDKVLFSAQENGINAIIGTPTYAVPSWLIKKHPDIMLTTKSGRIKYGPRQSIDVFHPAFIKHAERIIRKLIEHTASHPNVIGFQVDNETKHFDNYGPYAQSKFKEYLQNKYKTVQEFNKAFTLAYWSNAIGSWDDLPDLSNSINGNLLCEYETFLRATVTDYLLWQANIIKKYKRDDQFITHNFDFEWRNHSFGVQPSVAHYDTASALTIAGCDIYHPSQNALTGKEIAFCGDSTRCLKNKPYFIMETESQGFKQWTPYPGQLRLQAYSHLASGALGLMYWNWHSIHNSFETYWKGVLGHDLLPGAIYNEAALIGKEWNAVGAKISGVTKKNEIALVTDNCSLTALKYFPADESFSYNDIVRWVYDNLYEMNMECDVVDIHALDTSKYKILIIPALYCISKENAMKIKDFVHKGGVIFATCRSFYADEKATAYPQQVPYLLTDCFGMHYNMICKTDEAPYAELLETNGADTVHPYNHKYWSRYAQLTRNAYGSGYAWYYGAYEPKANLKEILKDVLNDCNIQPPKAKYPIIIRSGTNIEGKKIHFVFNYSSDESIFIVPYQSTKEIFSGEKHAVGDSISISDWDVKIFIEE